MSDLVTKNNDLFLLSEGDNSSDSHDKKKLGSAKKLNRRVQHPPNNTQMDDPIRIQEILKYINLNRSLHLLKSDKYLTILE